MRTPVWESAPGALIAFLNSTTQVYMADLFTITLVGGLVIRWTSADAPITVGGATYLIGPTIKRGKTRVTVGVQVDTLDITLNADPTVLVNGTPLLAFVAAGGFDNATVRLDRAFAAAPGQPWIGTFNMFSGRVADTTCSRYEAVLTANSGLDLLNVMIPRHVYAPGCGNTLFDGSCGLLKANFATAATATSGTDAPHTTFTTGLAQASGYFALGWAVGVTGANAGVARTIKSFSAGVIVTILGWPAAVVPGDTFTVYPGCDKTVATCTTKFNNVARFRGQPWVPAPETIA